MNQLVSAWWHRLALIALWIGLCCGGIGRVADAQVGGGAGGNAGGNAGGRNNNNAGGIKIDASGLVTIGMTLDHTDQLEKKRRQTLASKHLANDITQHSPLRKVSLVKLEQECLKVLENEESLPVDLLFLAGLQRIDYLFVSPETKDLIIAGPAEGFAPDKAGRMVGVGTGRPTLRLDDWLIAARASIQPANTKPANARREPVMSNFQTLLGETRKFDYGGKSNDIGCSIDPTKEGLAALQQFVAQNSSASSPGVAAARYAKMPEVLGYQNVSVTGIPDDSHFAFTMVEADYRMKRISLGLEVPPVKGFRSHLAMLQGGGNSTQRWWFVPLYDSLTKAPDGLAFHLEGQRAQLLSQEEVVDGQGSRSAAGTTRLSTKDWARHFTEKFPELADASPCFGELQNLIDWTIIAAIIQKEQLPAKIGWTAADTLDPDKIPYEKNSPPKKVMSIVNTKRAGGLIIGLVAGGVTIRPQAVLSAIPTRTDDSYTEKRSAHQTPTPPTEKHPWWWD